MLHHAAFYLCLHCLQKYLFCGFLSSNDQLQLSARARTCVSDCVLIYLPPGAKGWSMICDWCITMYLVILTLCLCYNISMYFPDLKSNFHHIYKYTNVTDASFVKQNKQKNCGLEKVDI